MEDLNWSELGFGYIKTNYNVRCYYRGDKQDKLEVSSSEIINTHMATTCLYYGQEPFEDLKAFRGKDDKIRVFRVDEDVKHMQSSNRGIKMAELPIEMFEEAVHKVVKLDERSAPLYESGATLYIRPLMIGLGAQAGVKPAPEHMFMIPVTPVGPYFKGGLQLSKVRVLREYDRAAPSGTGTIKAGGNYAASLVAGEIAHSKGYAAILYLDPKEKGYLDKCGPANSFGARSNSHTTPQSHSILPSITNKSSQQLAEDTGLTVEHRPIPFGEIAVFDEAAECGTTVVIAPISQIDNLDENKSFVTAKDGKPDPVCEKLYRRLHTIQCGNEPGTYGWISTIK